MSGKYALIIGNTEYTDPGLAQLTAPGKDAEDFARILKDQDLCAFDGVNIVLNQSESIVSEAIDEFFDQKKPDDLLILYFSGHGVRDELGALYLAVKNTNRFRLRSTAIKSDFIREAMDQSRSKRQVLILDCCNSGAFSYGTKAATGVSIGTAPAFEAGYGRVILTASDSTQFAWEGNQVIGDTANSLFTHFLVEGLKGEADLDGDGRITVDELYDYAYERVRFVTPKQTPSKFSSKQQGEIILRQFTRVEDIKQAPLTNELIDEIEDTRPYVREAAVQKLEKILKGRNIGLARSAREALEKIAADENTTRRVAEAAMQILESVRQKAEDERSAAEKTEAERRAKEERSAITKLEAEQLAEAKRLADEKAEAERKAQEKAEQLLVEQRAEEERIAKAKLEAKQLAEAKRLAEEKAEAKRKAKEDAAQLSASQKAEEDRVTKAKLESERQAEDNRLTARKAEQERLARERTETKERSEEVIQPIPNIDPANKKILIRMGTVATFVSILLLAVIGYFNFYGKNMVSASTSTATPGQPPSGVTKSASPTLKPSATSHIVANPQCTMILLDVNLRSGPGRAYQPPIGVLTLNTKVIPIGYAPVGIPDGSWVKVRNPETQQEGWITAESKYVSCNIALTTLPSVEVSTPPATLPSSEISVPADG